MTELAHQTALELAAKVRSMEVSSVELTQLCSAELG